MFAKTECPELDFALMDSMAIRELVLLVSGLRVNHWFPA